MRVDDLRCRLLDRVQEVAATGDEGATARITSYARAVLISIARHPADGDVNMEDLAVGTHARTTCMLESARKADAGSNSATAGPSSHFIRPCDSISSNVTPSTSGAPSLNRQTR